MDKLVALFASSMYPTANDISHLGYRAKTISLLIKNEHRSFTHDILIVEINNMYYFLEWNWIDTMRGVNGPFDSLFSLCSFVRRTYETTLEWKYPNEKFSISISS